MLSIDDFKKITIPDEFGINESDDDITYELEYVTSQLKKLHPADHFIWCFGMSKYVVLLDNLVVKIPFNGTFDYGIEDEETGEYSDEIYFQPFLHTSDYCSIEEEIYLKAAEAGLGNFFAATIKYDNTADGTPYYVSERVTKMYDEDAIVRRPSRRSQEIIKKKKEYKFVGINKTWLACALDRYGKKAVDAFLSFVKENKINDLHADNIGFRDNGDPVLLDYSSYRA